MFYYIFYCLHYLTFYPMKVYKMNKKDRMLSVIRKLSNDKYIGCNKFDCKLCEYKYQCRDYKWCRKVYNRYASKRLLT